MKECTIIDQASNERKLKHNYVFFFANSDYWRAILGQELYDHPNIKVYNYAFDGNRFLKYLFRIHWSYSINKRIRLPFKRIWFKKMYRQSFADNLPLCFVYLGVNSIRFDGGFTEYVKKQSSQNRQIILHNDLIAKKCDYDYYSVRNKVDNATTYDKGEAEKFGIKYFCETTYSKLLPEPERAEFRWDVYFLAAAKDRLPKIIAVYDKLEAEGLNCLFIICGVNPEDQIQRKGICYSEPISYEDNIRYVLLSKCILELIQGGSVDITTRALEAIAYRRRLLTDCPICEDDYFHPGQLQKFSSPEEIQSDFIKKALDPEEYMPLLDMNPLNRIYFFEEILGELS